MQSHSLYVISVIKGDRFNSIILYNPITSSYCRPPVFRLDESRLPITNFPNFLRFDGGLTCGLLRNNTDPIHKHFPLVTPVSIQHYNAPDRVTIKNIIIPLSPILKFVTSLSTEQSDNDSISSETQYSSPYVILLESGTTFKKSYDDLVSAGRDDDSLPRHQAVLPPYREFHASSIVIPKLQWTTKGNSTRYISTTPLKLDSSS